MLDNKKLFNNKIFYLHAKQLLASNTEIFDKITMERTTINWFLPKLNLNINNDTVIINRIHHLDRKWFNIFAKEYREYAFSELWSYLLFALNSFYKVYEKPGGVHCLLGNNMPLPLIWKKFDFLHIKTPHFFIGEIKNLPAEWEINKTIIKNTAYDYYWWRPNLMAQKDLNKYCLAILKPNGIPILVTQIENSMSCKILENQNNYEKKQLKEILIKLKNIARKIHKANQHWCSESLFFIDPKQQEFTFAMINNYMYASYFNDHRFVNNVLIKIKKIIN